MTPEPSHVRVHIEELVLHGFAPADREAIGAAVEAELGRLFGERGVPPSLAAGATVPGLDGGTFQARPGAGADAIGLQVARAVYRAL